ncbi:CBN-CUTL-20 protein [Caenorhabditis brenneri]|uniref:CBN-CUTL-20 protein n=1 Tax=Caenorhabditis brenneri TaxID=135651 RepID=G0MM46_CAEBE|nr:CBN-CUTL-20 protein [Caenorhabditis brenneri]
MIRLWIVGCSLSLLPSLIHAIAIVDTSIACDKTDFLLKIKFDDVFHGTIQSRTGVPKCIYANGTLQPDTKYQLKIPLKGCSTKENGEGNLENEIEVVMANNEFNVETDKRFLLTCIPAAPVPKESQVTVSFGGITINSDATTASSLLENKTVDYRVRVLDGASLDSKQLQRPLAVGDKVVGRNVIFPKLSLVHVLQTYTVEMNDDQNGRIGRCWANDGISELPLSDSQGCSLQTSGEVIGLDQKSFKQYKLQVWGDFEVARRNGKTIFFNHIKAWAFPTSNEVNIFCNLHVCVTCSQSACRGRERRHHHEPIADPFSSTIDVSDISPPIAVRTSFRLKRENQNVARLETSPNNMSTSSSASSANFLFLLPFLLIVVASSSSGVLYY